MTARARRPRPARTAARTALLAAALLTAALLTAALAPDLAAAELDEIVARSIAAQGGQAAWDALDSLVLTGDFSTFSMENPFVLYLEKPDRYRFEHKLGNFDMTLGFDGETAWWVTDAFFAEAAWPTEAPLRYRAQITGDAVFGGPLLDAGKRGHRLELVGRGDVDGVEVYEIRATLPHGTVETWYLDAETYLPVARVSPGADIDRPLERWSYFSDYREVAGVVLAHRVETEMGSRYQLLEITGVEAVDLDDALFAFPVAAEVERLAALAGEWRVQVATRLLPSMPWIPGETTATLRAEHHGHLLSEEMTYVAVGSPRLVRRWYSYDRFRELYRVTYFDSLTAHVNVLEGRFEDDRLVLTNLETGTTWSARGQTVHNRQVIHDIGPDGFEVDWDASLDGGRTWLTQARFVYVRADGG